MRVCAILSRIKVIIRQKVGRKGIMQVPRKKPSQAEGASAGVLRWVLGAYKEL